MKNMITVAMVLLLAQIVLTVAFNMDNKGIGTGTPDTPLLSFSPDAVQSLEFTDGEGKSLVLKKDKDGWVVPEHFSAPVDPNKIKELFDKLTELKQGFVVATSAEAAKRFKVDTEVFEKHVVLRDAEKPLVDFYVGTSPAFRQIHARRGDSSEIVTIPLSGFDLEAAVDKWLDTSLATLKDEDIVGLTFDAFKLKKAEDGWQLEGLREDEKINREEVDAVVTRAREVVVQDVLDPAKFSNLIARPAFRFTAARKDGRQVEYFFAKGEDDFYVLKMSDRDLYFKVHTLSVEALQKATREKLVVNAAAAEKQTDSAAKQ